MTRKTANKTAKPSPRNGNVLPLGAHSGNTGGKKGRSGRKTLDFTAECNALSDTEVLRQFREKLESEDGPDDAAWRWAAEQVLSYAKSKAPTRIHVDVDRLRSLSDEELKAIVAGKAR